MEDPTLVLTQVVTQTFPLGDGTSVAEIDVVNNAPWRVRLDGLEIHMSTNAQVVALDSTDPSKLGHAVLRWTNPETGDLVESGLLAQTVTRLYVAVPNPVGR